MKKRSLPQYSGSLSLEVIVNGMNASARNAERLFKDAEILFNAKSYPTSVSLASLAIEEAGKISILRGLSLLSDKYLIKKAWKDYRSHRSKNTSWIIPQVIAEGAKNVFDFKEALDPKSEHTYLLDSIKQLGFYTDFFHEKYCCYPSDVIDEDLAKKILFVAKLLSKYREITVREIELWVEYVRPHWGTSEMFQACVRWSEAMKIEGLSNNVEETKNFFFSENFQEFYKKENGADEGI